MTGPHRAADRVRTLGFDTHDPYRRSRAPERERDAGDQAATPDGDDDELHVREVIQDLETDRALPGDDEWIGVGMDECLALLPLDPMGKGERVVVHVAFE